MSTPPTHPAPRRRISPSGSGVAVTLAVPCGQKFTRAHRAQPLRASIRADIAAWWKHHHHQLINHRRRQRQIWLSRGSQDRTALPTTFIATFRLAAIAVQMTRCTPWLCDCGANTIAKPANTHLGLSAMSNGSISIVSAPAVWRPNRRTFLKFTPRPPESIAARLPATAPSVPAMNSMADRLADRQDASHLAQNEWQLDSFANLSVSANHVFTTRSTPRRAGVNGCVS